MNPTLRLPIDRVLALDPATVEAYLLAQGWEANRQASSRQVGVYHLPTDPTAEILLPRDRDFVDYALRLSEVLQALAAAERRPAWQVLEDLSARSAGAPANGAEADTPTGRDGASAKGSKRNAS